MSLLRPAERWCPSRSRAFIALATLLSTLHLLASLAFAEPPAVSSPGGGPACGGLPYRSDLLEGTLCICRGTTWPEATEREVMPLMAANREKFAGKTVLDIGTGSGILALFAARLGASKVIATDIEQRALACTRENARNLGVSEAIETRLVSLSDPSAYSTIRDGEAFDIIVSTPPFVVNRVAHVVSGAVDEGVTPNDHIKLALSILDGLGDHLREDGAALLSFRSAVLHDIVVGYARHLGYTVEHHRPQFLMNSDWQALYNAFAARVASREGIDPAALLLPPGGDDLGGPGGPGYPGRPSGYIDIGQVREAGGVLTPLWGGDVDRFLPGMIVIRKRSGRSSLPSGRARPGPDSSTERPPSPLDGLGAHGGGPGRSGSVAAATATRPNVILFFIDTLRADRLHCLGYPARTTPAIDAMASQGTLFETAISSASWSLPSYCSILSSLHPPSHAVSASAQYFDPSFVTLPEILSAHGYATGGFVAGGHLSRMFGLDDGFDTYSDEPHFGSFFHTVPRALEWMDARAREGPFFALIQGYDLHSPYQPPLGFSEMYDPGYRGLVHERDLLRPDFTLRVADNVASVPLEAPHPAGETGSPGETRSTTSGLASSLLDLPPGTRTERIPLSEADRRHISAHYDGAVTYADAWLGVLREELRARGLFESTVLVVASDHGESLGEHGYYGHLWDLWNDQLHVPLVFSGPGISAGRRIQEVVSMIDLAPTVLELCSIPPCEDFQGQSLSAHVGAAGSPPPPSDGTSFSAIDSAISARTARWQMILDGKGRASLYDLDADPTQQRDVSASHPKVAQLLRGQLLGWYEQHQRPPRAPDAKLTFEMRRMFRQKGYW